MSLNFLGLGFSFTAKDDGLAKMQKSVLKGFDALNKSLKNFGGDAIKNLNKDLLKVQENLKNISEDLEEAGGGGGGGGGGDDEDDRGGRAGKNAERWAKVKANLENISSAFKQVGGDSLNLTTGLESQYKAIDVFSKKYGAQINSTDSTIRKSVIFARKNILELGLSAEKLITDYQQFTLAQKTFAEAGIKDAETLSRITSVYELNSEKLQEGVTTLSSTLELSGEQIGKLFGALQQAGDKSHDTAAAMQSLGKVIQVITEQRGIGKSADDAFRFAQEGIQLTGVLGSMTNNYEAASKAADFFSKGLFQTEKGMRNLRAGTADDIHAFAQAIGTAVIPFEELQALSKAGGPAALFKRVFEVIAEAKRTGNTDKVAKAIQFMNAQFEKAGGSDGEIALLKQGLENVTPEMLLFKEASFDAAKAQEGFVNKLTDAEKYTGGHEQFRARFREIGESAKEWEEKVTASRKKFGDQIAAIAKEGDEADRDSLKRVAEISKFGLAAILPETFIPVIEMTNELGASFDAFGDILKDLPVVGGFIKPLLRVVAFIISIRPKLVAEMDAMLEAVQGFFEGFGMDPETARTLSVTVMGIIDSLSQAMAKLVTNPIKALKEAWANFKKATDFSEFLSDTFGNQFRLVMNDFSNWGPHYLMTRVFPNFTPAFDAFWRSIIPKKLHGALGITGGPSLGSIENAAKLKQFDTEIAGMSPRQLEYQKTSLTALMADKYQMSGKTQEQIDLMTEKLATVAAALDKLAAATEKSATETRKNTEETAKNTKGSTPQFGGIAPPTTTSPSRGSVGTSGVPNGR